MIENDWKWKISIAFHAVINTNPVLMKGDKVKFNVLTLNDGNGYHWILVLFLAFSMAKILLKYSDSYQTLS